mgnify:CR=1 FL=1
MIEYRGIKYREFETQNELVQWERETLTGYKELNTWDNPKRKALEFYAGNLYGPINSECRASQKGIVVSGRKYVVDSIFNLSLLMKENPVPINVVTHRYIHQKAFPNLLRASRDEYKLKGIGFLLEKGFSSTTLLPTLYAEQILGESVDFFIQLTILVPKGSLGVFPTLIAGRSNEAELILAPYSKIRILSWRGKHITGILCAQQKIFPVYDEKLDLWK